MRLFLFSLLLSSSLLSLTPLPTQAALIPCGRSSGTQQEMAPCTLCHLIIGIKGIIDWMRTIMTALAITVIVAMGILYIISTGNDQMMQTAKHGLTASLIGLAVILGAWLIVNFTLTLPIIKVDGLVKKNWNTVSCDIASSAGTQIASTPSGITDKTSGSTLATETPYPTTIQSPSTGISLSFSQGKSAFYAGEQAPITVGGNLQPQNGPISFQITTTDASMPETTTTTSTLSILSRALPGTYQIIAYQNNQPLNQDAPLLFTIKEPLYPGGTDPGGGGDPSNPGGDGEGGACIGNSPEGIPYNNKLPLAPMTSWTGQQQYDYWLTIPAQTDLQDPNIWGYNGYSEPIKYAMWKYGNNEFRALVSQKTFGNSNVEQSRWINGNDQWLKAGMSFDFNTGIGTYGTLAGVDTKVYPASGIPPRVGCVTSGGGNTQPWNGTCPGYSTVYRLNVPWLSSGGNGKAYLASLENGAALVASFTTPTTLRPRTGSITSYEARGVQACKTVVLSKTPCDFTGPGLGKTSGSTAPLYFSGGGSTLGVPVLQPNTTYYYNVVHRCYSPPSGRDVDTCVGTCDVDVELNQP